MPMKNLRFNLKIKLKFEINKNGICHEMAVKSTAIFLNKNLWKMTI